MTCIIDSYLRFKIFVIRSNVKLRLLDLFVPNCYPCEKGTFQFYWKIMFKVDSSLF